MDITPLQVIGLGSYQGDDRAGWEVVSKLQAIFQDPSHFESHARVEFILASHPLECLDHFHVNRPTWIVDACQSDTICDVFWRAVWPATELPASSNISTHGASLRECLELAAILHCCPAPLVIYAIPGITWEPNHLPQIGTQSRITAAISALERELREALALDQLLSG